MEYDAINQVQNGIELLSLIQMITHTYNEQNVKHVDALDIYKADYYALKHNCGQSVDDLYKAFHAQVQVCKDVGLQFYYQSLLDQITTDNW